MVTITVEINQADVKRWADTVFGRQIPFATSRAINATATDFQKRQREHQREVFTVRRATFVDRAVKITQFAKKNAQAAEIAIDPPGGSARADILTQHEDGGLKTPRGRSLAIPEEARRTEQSIVRASNRPRAYDFQRVSARGGVEVYRGNRRTYMIRKPDGSGVIRQRTGKGKHGTHAGTKLLFGLTPDAQIRPVLDFEDNAKDTVRKRFQPNFTRELANAIATAR